MDAAPANDGSRPCTRRDFAKGIASVAALAAAGRLWSQSHGPTGDADLDLRQSEIDAVRPKDFAAYCAPGLDLGGGALSDAVSRLPALGRLEAAFEKVFREAKETVVADANRPAVWYVYNMGLVVKTKKTMFSIDLHHRRAEEFAPLLDFALITHRHLDHYTKRFRDAMDSREGKTVVSNFFGNGGAKKVCGYTRERTKTFRFGDVTVVTGLCDHNKRLVDYTTPFEVHVGDFTLYHSGDCGDHAKLQVSRRPDLWVLHPFCGMDPVKGAKKIRPKKVVVAHLQELGHEKDRWRWTYRDGLQAKADLGAAGVPAVMPLWGDRLV